MAVKTSEEIMNYIKEKTKDDTSDETLQFVEDISDTLNDYETRTKNQTDWEQKYKDNDTKWRQKYRDRFFAGGDDEEKPEEPKKNEEDKKPKSFNDLFTFTDTKPDKWPN